jgi:hypothetical protein
MMNWEAMCLRVAPSERRNPISRQAYWLGTHGPIGAAIPTMSRYVQSHTCLGAYGRATPPPFDGLGITWWEGLDAMRASAETAEYQATRDDEPDFIGVDPAVILTTEHVIVGYLSSAALARSAREITSFWISLVPSPMIISGASL